MDNKSKIINDILHFNRLEQSFLRITKEPVGTLVEIKEIINSGIRIIEINKCKSCMKSMKCMEVIRIICYKDMF